MEEKKIATSVDVLINVGQFEHLQITKYAEKKITYENEAEMIKKEDQLTDELVKDVIRTMRSMPDKLGKKTSAVINIEDKIQKKIPTWLEEGSEPNIANTAKVNADKAVAKTVVAEEKKRDTETSNSAETDSFLNSVEEDSGKTSGKTAKVNKPDSEAVAKPSSDDDLFDDEDLFKT